MTAEVRCSTCDAPAHGTTWRCEGCRGVFDCPGAFVERPDGIATVPCHPAFPVVGWKHEGNTLEPLLGELVTCGPIVINAGPSLTERAMALAADQRQRHERVHLVEDDSADAVPTDWTHSG